MGVGHSKITGRDKIELRTNIKIKLFRVATRSHDQLKVRPRTDLNLVVSTCGSILIALCGFYSKSSTSACLQRNNLVIIL
jgi:hypothetical protein